VTVRELEVGSAEPRPLGAANRANVFSHRRSRSWGRWWPGLASGAVLGLIIATAIFAGRLGLENPTRQDIMSGLTPPLARVAHRLHLLGTDQLGRDMLSRVIYGSRVSLMVSTVSVAGSGFLGTTLGLGAGFLGGPLDTAVMRLVELQLAFPIVLLALVMVAFVGPSLTNIIVVFTLTSWPVYARTVRAMVLDARQQEYVEAARALGSSSLRVLGRHILINVVDPLIVLASFEVARLMLLEASLGFLGLGVQPPTPSWGNMLADGRDYLDRGWWIAAFPGVALLCTAGAINYLGDTLRDLLDPRMRTL
jgi:peptide/nickel transport system permease protein